METCSDQNACGDERNVTRRSVIVGAIHALWIVIGGALGLPVSAYLLRAPKAKSKDEWINIGDITALPHGQPIEMLFQHNHTDSWKTVTEKRSAWVVKTPESVVAFGPRCTHLGCAHHWDNGRRQFVCPCHNSLFAIDGKVLAGPARRPLDRYDVKLDGTRLLLGSLRPSPEDVA